jgi:TRAF3-interacting protein 1
MAKGAGGGGGEDKDGGDEALGDDGEPGKRSLRPTTARRRPPKVKDNVRPLDQPGAAGAAPPKATAHIMADGGAAESDDEAEAKGQGKADGGGHHGGGIAANTDEGASKLVRDIESEARGEGGDAKGEDRLDDSKGIRLGRIKKSADGAKAKKGMSSWSEQDIDALRTSVQRLCQSTNPLGKCMDFVHEDLTAMSKEYERWQQE